MAAFSPAEIGYLTSGRRFGRVATVDATGQPHVVPVGFWRYNAELGTIDIAGHGLAGTKKFRNVRANPKVAFVVDDMASIDPWHPRAVMVQGRGEAIQGQETPFPGSDDGVIRIVPTSVLSWGLEDEG